MSEQPTPRVDEECQRDSVNFEGRVWVSSNFARGLEREMEAARAELLKWENVEGVCCPEDVGFPEFIANLQAENQRLRARLEPFASGNIDVSGTAVILGYGRCQQALEAARQALGAGENNNKSA